MNYSLPLVSIIVVNFNYGRYLRTAVDSVSAQKYSNIQCIVVDDASTDDSARVLDEIARESPVTRIIRRRENGGQIAACLDGLLNSEGAYVVFLDADDFLFEDFVASHVYIHLSLRDPVGFSCSDMVQLAENQMVLGGLPTLGNHVRAGASPVAARPLPSSRGGQWLDTIDRGIIERTYKVDASERHWPWSATSAFVFRRDALDLWVKTPVLKQLRRSPDGFFGRAINAICGSVVIDETLGAYRVHGTNVFSRGIPLAHLRHFDSSDEHSSNYRRLLLDEVVRDPARFAFHTPNRILKVLETLDGPVVGSRRSAATSYALQCARQNYNSLASYVGKGELDRWLFKQRLRLLKRKLLGS